MFLKRLLKENLKFVEATLQLYNEKKILPDTYCIDVDMFIENAKKILNEAKKYNITLYYMLKQLGRNPYLAKKLEEIGYAGAVCVDFKEVEIMMKNNLKLGNVGHLVQIPNNMIEKVISYGVSEITVYSYEMMEKISNYCEKIGKVQDIMLRIVENNSNIYEGQEAGFSCDEVKEILDKIKKLKGIRLNGLTSFPCFVYSTEKNKIEETNNLKSLIKVKKMLEENEINVEHINLPSVSTVENMKMISDFGGTEAEPGHALTGTTPMTDSDEIPAYLYLSEISHNFKGKSYFYGGGYYSRGNLNYAYIDNEVVLADEFCPNNIDYYLSVKKICNIFSPVIMCFRTQMFVTRSDVILIEGVQKGNAKIIGRYNTQGELKDG